MVAILCILCDNVPRTLLQQQRCDMAFIEPMHRNKPNITYLLQQHSPEDVITENTQNSNHWVQDLINDKLISQIVRQQVITWTNDDRGPFLIPAFTLSFSGWNRVLSVSSTILAGPISTCWIHFIFINLIKQLQRVCPFPDVRLRHHLQRSQKAARSWKWKELKSSVKNWHGNARLQRTPSGLPPLPLAMYQYAPATRSPSLTSFTSPQTLGLKPIKWRREGTWMFRILLLVCGRAPPQWIRWGSFQSWSAHCGLDKMANILQMITSKLKCNLESQISRAGASTTRVLVLSKMVNMNILKTSYSSTDFPVLVLVC